MPYRQNEKKVYETHDLKKQQNMQQYPDTQKYIGGFPLEFCSFTPEYHRI